MEKIPYTMVSEEEASLFNRRIRLAELTVLTITALMVILSFTENRELLIPVAILSINLIIIIAIIIFGANKIISETNFSDNSVDATKKDISYTLHKRDITTFILYAFAIFLMLYMLL